MGDQKDYNQLAKELRQTTIKMIHKAQSSHVGSCFSSADLCTVLYEIADMEKDVVLIKPWNVANVYACLVRKGLLPKEAVEEYGTGQWTTIAEPIPPYQKFGCGAMGYDLPAAVGFALAKKLKKEEGKVYCLISDGELNIGSTWESLLIAAHHKLDNLILIVDFNGLQAMGSTKDILNTGDLEKKEGSIRAKIRNFGWYCGAIDGHNYKAIEGMLKKRSLKPKCIIAQTVKGKGVSFMAGDNIWHYQHVNDEILNKALEELK